MIVVFVRMTFVIVIMVFMRFFMFFLFMSMVVIMFVSMIVPMIVSRMGMSMRMPPMRMVSMQQFPHNQIKNQPNPCSDHHHESLYLGWVY